MSDVEAKRELVETAKAMLAGELSYLEGTMQILRIRKSTSGFEFQDSDFKRFDLIYSETDALPFENDKHLWSKEALTKLEPDLKRAEKWAESVAKEACENLVKSYERT